MDVWVKKKGVTPCLGQYTRRGSRFFSSPRVCWLTALADSYPFVTFFLSAKKSGKGMERTKALGKEGEKWLPLMKREFAESFPS